MNGRPYGGCFIVWCSSLNLLAELIDSGSRCVSAVVCSSSDKRLLCICAYEHNANSCEECVCVSINPNGTVHPMYMRKAVSISDRDRVCTTRLRLSSHSLAIETGRWSRIPRDKRLCSCGAVPTEEHVICFCPISQHVRSQSEFVAVEFINIVKFFDCADLTLFVVSAV